DFHFKSLQHMVRKRCKRPRHSLCSKQLLPTLGTTFSTTGANVVIIPLRASRGCCAFARQGESQGQPRLTCFAGRHQRCRLQHSAKQLSAETRSPTAEAVESGEAAAPEYIFLRTASMLAWQWQLE